MNALRAMAGDLAPEKVAVSAGQISVSFGKTPILHGIDLALRAGRWTSIVGPNGAGKSTLLKALAGLLPSAGQVQLLGRPLHAWPRRERARALSWLGQNESAADDLTVYDVAMLGRLPHQGWMQPPSSADHAAVEHALRTTQAWDWRARALGQLSGGERQRVLLARSLAASGTTVVSVLHELSFALHADDVVVLAGGRLQHHGTASDPATHRALERVFDQRIAIYAVAGQWVALPQLAPQRSNAFWSEPALLHP